MRSQQCKNVGDDTCKNPTLLTSLSHISAFRTMRNKWFIIHWLFGLWYFLEKQQTKKEYTIIPTLISWSCRAVIYNIGLTEFLHYTWEGNHLIFEKQVCVAFTRTFLLVKFVMLSFILALKRTSFHSGFHLWLAKLWSSLVYISDPRFCVSVENNPLLRKLCW